MVLVLLLLPLASSASAPPKFEHKKSTMLSFDLRRKTKHHRHRNTTAVTATPAPTADSDQEEMEFTLRVCCIIIVCYFFSDLREHVMQRPNALNTNFLLYISFIFVWKLYIWLASCKGISISVFTFLFFLFVCFPIEHLLCLCYRVGSRHTPSTGNCICSSWECK